MPDIKTIAPQNPFMNLVRQIRSKLTVAEIKPVLAIDVTHAEINDNFSL